MKGIQMLILSLSFRVIYGTPCDHIPHVDLVCLKVAIERQPLAGQKYIKYLTADTIDECRT